MACGACSKRRLMQLAAAAAAELPATEFMFTAARTSITLKTGETTQINRALIQPMKRPEGGWAVRFRINGVDKHFDGKSPELVAQGIAAYLQLQRKTFRMADIWLNLNIQWYERISPNYQLAVDKALTELIAEEAVTDGPKRWSVDPSVWLMNALSLPGIYLSGDSYQASTFISHLSTVLELLNPNTNPQLGRATTYALYNAEFSQIRANPVQVRADARLWFYGFVSALRKSLSLPPVSWENVGLTYHWL